MRVLCTFDFSESSMSAVEWTAKWLSRTKGNEIEIIHCITVRNRSDVFIDLAAIVREQAEKDMDRLIRKMEEGYPDVVFSASVINGPAKRIVPAYAKEKNFDFIAMSTHGMSFVKDITMGSVTQAILKKSDVPVIVIPSELAYHPTRRILLAVDKEGIPSGDTVSPLIDYIKGNESDFEIIHVQDEEEPGFNAEIDVYFNEFSPDFKTLEKSGSISDTLSGYSEESGADMLCMIHRKRTGIDNIFHASVVKSGLYHLNKPLMVLPA